jgi:hypothetical protein
VHNPPQEEAQSEGLRDDLVVALVSGRDRCGPGKKLAMYREQ